MKNKVYTALFLFASLILAFFSCSKSKISEDANPIPFPTDIPLDNCSNGPDYGATVICPQWRGPNGDHKIRPKNDPGVGTYFAWPEGLVIDHNTGEVNVSDSETGARYIIGFVRSGTHDTCLKELTIGGVTYVDSVYVLSANDTLALPHFNANPLPTTICDPSDDTDYPGNSSGGNGGGSDKCEFDDGSDDDNGNGQADEPPPGQRANDQKVRVRTLSGIINLKKTLEEGAFGSNPQNGDRKQVTIYYRLNDCSVKALQHIKVDLIYYEKKSDIPVTLLNDLRVKRTNFMEARIIDPNGKPRPPQIFVTRYY
jgi:hypothetical protein